MKKVLSTTLLFVFLFNVGGYYVVFLALRYQTDQALTNRLDAELYEASETVEIKIPVTLPYPIQSQGFERVNGRFEHQGQHYKLVKQKLSNDTLYVICIRDDQTRRLVATMDDYVKRTQPLPASDAGKDAMAFLSKLIKDYCSHARMVLFGASGFTSELFFDERPELFQPTPGEITGPPPKA